MKRKWPKPGDRAEIVYVNDFHDPPYAQVEFRLYEDDDFTTRNLYDLDRIRPAPARSEAA